MRRRGSRDSLIRRGRVRNVEKYPLCPGARSAGGNGMAHRAETRAKATKVCSAPRQPHHWVIRTPPTNRLSSIPANIPAERPPMPQARLSASAYLPTTALTRTKQPINASGPGAYAASTNTRKCEYLPWNQGARVHNILPDSARLNPHSQAAIADARRRQHLPEPHLCRSSCLHGCK